MSGDGLFVGAYAASPAHTVWDAAEEKRYYELLTEVPELRGMELPWMGALHPHDPGWLLRRFPARFDAVLTSIPGTMTRLGSKPGFGLASSDEHGRHAAVEEALRMRDGAKALNDVVGRRAVVAIELHSAPVGAAGSLNALRRSLLELDAAGDWDGADLVVEHCDAWIPGQPPEKGFLSVADELSALDGLPDRFGTSVNWGRSAIELRDADAVARHIGGIAASGRLHGLMLSGAAAEATAFGPAWVDAHHPMAPVPGFPQGEPASLLTLPRVEAAVVAAGHVRWTGFKFGWADASAPAASRVEMVAAAARVIASVVAGAAAAEEPVRG